MKKIAIYSKLGRYVPEISSFRKTLLKVVQLFKRKCLLLKELLTLFKVTTFKSLIQDDSL